ncbi:MAG: ArsR/SmtB family transcription factor [Thermomicrobiales bacterium]
MEADDAAAPMQTEQKAKIFAALADPTRLRLVELLIEYGELSGTQMAEKAGISPALTSHHWRILHEAGLITRRKAGQTTYCSLNRAALATTFHALLQE